MVNNKKNKVKFAVLLIIIVLMFMVVDFNNLRGRDIGIIGLVGVNIVLYIKGLVKKR